MPESMMDASLIVQILPVIAVLAVFGVVIYLIVRQTREEARLGAGIMPGFKGWLLLLAIGLVLTPLRLLFHVVEYYGNPDILLAFREFPLAAYTEVGLNAVLFIVALATVFYMVSRKREFKLIFYVQYFINVIVLPLSALATGIALHLRDLEPQLFGEEGIMGTVAISRWIGVVVIGGLWAAYVAKSRRVAVTFVN
jgi:hypothetical protein